MITTIIEAIGPAQAQAYLNCVHMQRPVSKAHVQKLARSMASGHWRETAEAIQFDINGHLMNGQHRMHAVIQTGLTFNFLVARGLDPHSYEVMDQGRARTRGETLSTLAFPSANKIAASAVILVRMKYGLDIDRTNVDNSEIVQFAEPNRDALIWAVNRAKRYTLLPASTYGAFLFLAYHANATKAAEFADAVLSGANLEPDSPILLLRKKAEIHSRSVKKLDLNRTSNLLPFIVHAYNKFARGEKTTRLQPPSEPCLYPVGLDPDTFWDDK
jgi:hypothetical protein